MNKIKGVIFDLDGTLINTKTDLINCLNFIMKEEKRNPVTIDMFPFLVGDGAYQCFERAIELTGKPLASSKTKELFDKYSIIYDDNPMNETFLYDGALKVLQTLDKLNIKMTVVTNKPLIPAQFILKKLGAAQYFKAIICPENVKNRKPHPEPILKAMEIMGTNNSNSIMVGDSLPDVNSAKAALVPVIAMTYGYSHVPYKEIGADYLCDKFEDILDIIIK